MPPPAAWLEFNFGDGMPAGFTEFDLDLVNDKRSQTSLIHNHNDTHVTDRSIIVQPDMWIGNWMVQSVTTVLYIIKPTMPVYT